MTKMRLSLITIVVICLGSTWVAAKRQLKDPRELTFGTDGTLSQFKAKTARQLMSKFEYEFYVNALARHNCDDAHILLNTAFIREYPQFERARLKSKCSSDQDCRYWAHYARVNFREYGYCTAVRELHNVGREIHQRQVVAPKFRLKWWRERTVYKDRRIEQRDRILAIVIGQAESGYRPALIKLADLVKRGEVFNADGEIEYYILQRACTIGSDCAALASRLAELRRRITPDRISVIETKALTKPPGRPRLQLLLLGEKL